MSSWSCGGHRCQRARRGESLSRRSSRHLPGTSRDRGLRGAARLESRRQPAAAETSTVVAGRNHRGGRPRTGLWRRVVIDARGCSSTQWTCHDGRYLCPPNRGTRRAAAIRLNRPARCSWLVARLLVARCSLARACELAPRAPEPLAPEPPSLRSPDLVYSAHHGGS
jgi:hypothetical protein